MIAKILFTALVVVGVLLWAKLRSRAVRAARQRASATGSEVAWQTRAVAVAVIAGAVAIAGLYFYLEWQRANDEVQVRVVNSRTGAYQSYLARKVDVGARRFITLDGRQITIADVERLEIVDQP